MTALERIRELEELMDHAPDWKFTMRAFRVMEELAVRECATGNARHNATAGEKIIHTEFEQRMKELEKKEV